MTPQQFSLGLLTQFGPPAWQAVDDRLAGGDWWTGRYYVQLAQRLEAAGLDYLFFLDTLAVRRDSSGSMEEPLRHAVTAPSHDPLPLMSMVAAATEQIGLIATASTTVYPPYMVARLFSTLDSITGGRVGWNIVNSFEQAEAQNYGLEQLPDHASRYERGEEYLEVVRKLWDSWEEGALVADEATDTYIDPSKVHEVDHHGEFFDVRGPLNVLRSPQGTPLLVQAGASDRGRAFAAKHAELTFVPGDDGSIERARSARDDVRARAAAFGRDPDSIKVIFPARLLFVPDGWDPSQGFPISDFQLKAATLWLSQSLDTDLTQYPLDEPFPLDAPPSGIRSMFEGLLDMSRQGMTLRESILRTRYSGGDLEFLGTPEQIAEKMIHAMNEIGGDGFILLGTQQFNSAELDAITDRLVPALRAAGAIRDGLGQGSTFRERLFSR